VSACSLAASHAALKGAERCRACNLPSVDSVFAALGQTREPQESNENQPQPPAAEDK
jgi:hypothetical protein